jgi:hypothetical protein
MKCNATTAKRYYENGQWIRIDAIKLNGSKIIARVYGVRINSNSLLTFKEQCKIIKLEYPKHKLEFYIIPSVN